MGALRDLAAKLMKISEDDITNAVLKIIRDDKSFAIDLNTGQLFSGVDSTGQMLDHYRSPGYADFKLTLNPKGVTDLKVTGQFYASFFMNAEAFPISFSATDSKKDELTKKYGENIFGLTKESISSLNKDILPEIQKYYLSLVQL